MIRALSHGLPPVLLLRGPDGVGKHTVATHLMDAHGVLAVDRIELDAPSAAEARTLRDQVSLSPCGAVRAVLICLDGCSAAALSALLIVLENPPPDTRFILTASHPVPDTLASRAMVWHCGLLRLDESRQVLTGLGMTSAAAGRAAEQAHGRALPPLVPEQYDVARGVVVRLLRAAVTADVTLLAASLRAVNRDVEALFHTALVETVTGRRREFTAAELVLPPEQARQVLFAFSRIAGARPALTVRVALESVLRLPVLSTLPSDARLRHEAME